MDQTISIEQEMGTDTFRDQAEVGDRRKRRDEEIRLYDQIGSDEKAEAIVERVNARLQSGVRASRIRAECEGGITSQQLEDILACKPPDRGRPFGIWWRTPETTKQLLALEKWVDEEEAGEDGTTAYAETAVFNRVYGHLDMAHRARSLVALTGLYGIGKSFAARRYALEHTRGAVASGAVMFEFPPGCKGDVGVLDAVLLALEPHSPIKGTVTAKLDRILEALRPGDFLIADECGIPAERGSGLRFMSYIEYGHRTRWCLLLGWSGSVMVRG
ncbi:MAG: hypothetical protein C0607_03160 [Azoarcus sp.]|nr:MAG: hypothetical protein C0607_03160 [Azoarcus sp.]